jgi:hypothetical protein
VGAGAEDEEGDSDNEEVGAGADDEIGAGTDDDEGAIENDETGAGVLEAMLGDAEDADGTGLEIAGETELLGRQRLAEAVARRAATRESVKRISGAKVGSKRVT